MEALVNPNAASTFSRVLGWGLIKLNLRTPTLSELRRRYSGLRPDVRQVGLDDELLGLEWFREQSIREGEALLQGAGGSVAELCKYAQTGVPVSLRPRIWRRILGVWTSERDVAYYERLISHVRRWDMVTDDLYRLEVQETADHSEHFVFEDMLDEMMLAFSRDSWLPANCPIKLNSAPLSSPVVNDHGHSFRSPIANPDDMAADNRHSKSMGLDNEGKRHSSVQVFHNIHTMFHIANR